MNAKQWYQRRYMGNFPGFISLSCTMVATAFTAPFSVSIASRSRTCSSSSFLTRRSLKSSVVRALPNPRDDSSKTGFSSGNSGLCLRLDGKNLLDATDSYRPIEAQSDNPPIMPAMMTPGGPMDLSSVLLRNRIIFIGQPINAQVAQRVISQLVTLAAIDENSDILIYLNCPGGNIYSVLTIYDCMSWIKPKVGTVCFAVTASEAAIILAGGEKGMRYAMPNARILLHQPQGVCGGRVENVKRQVKEIVHSRHKIDKMLSAFTGQPIEEVQQYTEVDHFLSPAEALEFGLIDGILETKY